jgi:O-antigen ligase
MTRIANKIDVVVFIGLLALMAQTVIFYGTVDEWWEATFECSVFLLTALWFIEVIFRGSWKLERVYVLFPLALITAYMFIQTLPLSRTSVNLIDGLPVSQNTLTIDRYQTQLTAIKTLALSLFMALLLLHTSSAKRFKWLVRVIIGLGIASAAFGILRQLSQSTNATSGFILPFLFPGIGYGQFLSSNLFAFLMEMVYGLILALVLGGAIRRQLILVYVAVGAVLWAALVLSNSRGAVIGLICQSILILLFAFSWLSSRRIAAAKTTYGWYDRVLASGPVRIIGIVTIVGILLAGVLWLGGEQMAGKHSTDDELVDGITRGQIWHASWEMIKRNPWTGVGFGAYFLGIPQYQTGAGRVRLEQAHNDYLDLAASSGAVGVVLAALFAGVVIWRARASLQSRDVYRRCAALGAMSAILSVAVHSLVDFGLQITGIAVIFSALLVILIADQVEEKPPRRKSHIERGSVSRHPAVSLASGYDSAADSQA